MGEATDWQQEVVSRLEDTNYVIMNPRRDDWDSSWVQSKDNPQFRQQVEWELTHLQDANVILVVFDANGYSPITLLELGMISQYVDQKQIIVYCPDGFWRKGNVDIFSEWFGITVADSFDQAVDLIRESLDCHKW